MYSLSQTCGLNSISQCSWLINETMQNKANYEPFSCLMSVAMESSGDIQSVARRRWDQPVDKEHPHRWRARQLHMNRLCLLCLLRWGSIQNAQAAPAEFSHLQGREGGSVVQLRINYWCL